MKPKQKLTNAEIQEFLRNHPEWTLEDDMLVRFWSFADFAAAMDFVNRVGRLAEDANHHPDIDIRYNRVKLALSSHDAGGITARDTSMASQLSDDSTLSTA